MSSATSTNYRPNDFAAVLRAMAPHSPAHALFTAPSDPRLRRQSQPSPCDQADWNKRAQLRAIIANRAIQMHFQPAVRIDRPHVPFVEALARFPHNEPVAPIAWFHAAHAFGLGVELEMLAVDTALGHLHDLPAETALSINVTPDVLITSAMLKRLARIAGKRRLIIEITEHRPVKDYAALAVALAPLRAGGLRIAVDDVGAGHANLRHVLDLKPDMIKLDMCLSRGIEHDPGRRAMVTAMVQFARATGADLVAEGIESPAELTTLRTLGIKIVQGHLYARPAAFESLGAQAIAA